MRYILSILFIISIVGCCNVPIKEGVEVRKVILWKTFDAEEICYDLTRTTTVECTCVKQDICTIIVHPDVVDDVLGHALRHCYEGAWHMEDIKDGERVIKRR